MTTEVILTGTGVPHPRPGCAGAGTLVRCGAIALQFAAGRATVLRLVEAGVPPRALTAVFVTHVHSDHLVGLPDVAMTRWIEQQVGTTGPLVVVTPAGPAARFVRRMLDPYDEDIAVRRAHVGAGEVGLDVREFPVPATAEPVWASGGGGRPPRAGRGRGRLPGGDPGRRGRDLGRHRGVRRGRGAGRGRRRAGPRGLPVERPGRGRGRHSVRADLLVPRRHRRPRG